MELNLKIKTNRPTMVANYLDGILQQMKRCKHFNLNGWEVERDVGVEMREDSNLITVRNIKTAEAVKLFENVYTDVNIALANEFAILCEKVGVDFIEVMEAANTQPLCHLLRPGIVGGQITKQPHILIEEAENVNAKLRMTLIARKINNGMLRHALRLTRNALQRCGKTIRRAKISVFGVAYQPNIKDDQWASTKKLVGMLHRRGANVKVYDPLFTYKELKDMGYPVERTLTKTVEGADCLLIVVGHDKFKRINLKRIKFLIRRPAAIVDMGRVITPEKAEKEGFVYFGVGRGA